MCQLSFQNHSHYKSLSHRRINFRDCDVAPTSILKKHVAPQFSQQQPMIPKKSVRFLHPTATDNDVMTNHDENAMIPKHQTYFIMSRQEYSINEKNSCWYTSDELSIIRKRARKFLVKNMTNAALIAEICELQELTRQPSAMNVTPLKKHSSQASYDDQKLDIDNDDDDDDDDRQLQVMMRAPRFVSWTMSCTSHVMRGLEKTFGRLMTMSCSSTSNVCWTSYQRHEDNAVIRDTVFRMQSAGCTLDEIATVYHIQSYSNVLYAHCFGMADAIAASSND
jgi:hypothetical protein